jgi:multicomponent Na+:H+ antiporter subunit G
MTMETLSLLDWARLGFGGALVAIGLVFMLGGAIGLLRFPDFYTRLHAAGVSDAAGAVFVLAGLAVSSGDGAIVLRLALLGALIVAVAPTLAHLAANAAHGGGLAPLAGPYVAPRPGAQRRADPPA